MAALIEIQDEEQFNQQIGAEGRFRNLEDALGWFMEHRQEFKERWQQPMSVKERILISNLLKNNLRAIQSIWHELGRLKRA